MQVRKLIREPKALIEPGKWADGGSRGMPKSAFPLSKTRSFQLGKSWRWRVDRISVSGMEGRLLTALEPSKEKFLAWLSLCRGNEFSIIARYEFHGDEPGWHVHSLCGNVAKIPVAVVKPYGTLRIPKANNLHRRSEFGVTERDAISLSFKVFRVEAGAKGSLI